MRIVFIALLGLVLGFFFGEALAALAGMISFIVFSSTPSGLDECCMDSIWDRKEAIRLLFPD